MYQPQFFCILPLYTAVVFLQARCLHNDEPTMALAQLHKQQILPLQLLHTHHTHNRFTAFFQDHPGESVPEENF